MSRNNWLIASIFLLFGSISFNLPAFELKLLTENSPPFNMSAGGGNFARGDQVVGIATNVVREVCKKANVSCEITLRFPWNRIYQQTLERSDYGIFSMARTPERASLFQWVGPVAKNKWVFLAKADSSITLNKLGDAKKYIVGAYKGDAKEKFLTDNGFNLQTSLKDDRLAKKLDEGKIDLWASSELSGQMLAKKLGISVKQVFVFGEIDLFIGLNKEVPADVASKMQKAVEELNKSGRIYEIQNSYFR
ncbi:substrate-binding periplasmic protein [Zooshikella sp. RANM57]|uniref:substrate-binding periplasmic protein n=1 Tax=Zooshikella sp. RANM57 TaxID=3425863 RepID=UPI003D6F6E40